MFLRTRLALCLAFVLCGEKRYVRTLELLPKGFLLIKDAKVLDSSAYSDFMFFLL
jgi:hypothetical protein